MAGTLLDTQQNLRRLQSLLRAEGLAGAILHKPQHVFYLSSFNPIIQSHPMLLVAPAEGDASLIIHSIRENHARAEASALDIRLYGAWGGSVSLAATPVEALKVVLEEKGLLAARLGLEFDHLPVALYEKIRRALPRAELLDAGRALLEARGQKSAPEIDLIRKAAGLADRGMEAALEAMRERGTEVEVSRRAEVAMREFWAREMPEVEVVDFGGSEGGIFSALWCYCLSGPRMNLYCDSSKPRPIRAGDLAMAVVWTACHGYHAEIERTVGVEPLSEEQRRAFKTVLRARAEAQEKLRPGITCAEVYDAAARVFAEGGYPLPGRIGHGIGLGAHEPPSLGPKEDLPLEPGMVLSFEPAIRIGEEGGVQHSDTVLITEGEPEFLTHTEGGMLIV